MRTTTSKLTTSDKPTMSYQYNRCGSCYQSHDDCNCRRDRCHQDRCRQDCGCDDCCRRRCRGPTGPPGMNGARGATGPTGATGPSGLTAFSSGNIASPTAPIVVITSGLPFTPIPIGPPNTDTNLAVIAPSSGGWNLQRPGTYELTVYMNYVTPPTTVPTSVLLTLAFGDGIFQATTQVYLIATSSGGSFAATIVYTPQVTPTVATLAGSIVEDTTLTIISGTASIRLV